jgi:hypothetical protein
MTKFKKMHAWEYAHGQRDLFLKTLLKAEKLAEKGFINSQREVHHNFDRGYNDIFNQQLNIIKKVLKDV